MAFLSALRTAGSALTAQRLRTDVIANNVANVQTTRTPEGGAYQRQQVIFGPRAEGGTFRSLLARGLAAMPGMPALPSLPGMPTLPAGVSRPAPLGGSLNGSINGSIMGGRVPSGPATGAGVVVNGVGSDGRPAKRVFEPDHPDADAEGFVDYPDIDPVTEMADMLSASRAYEANVTMANAAKGMAQKAMELGR